MSSSKYLYCILSVYFKNLKLKYLCNFVYFVFHENKINIYLLE